MNVDSEREGFQLESDEVSSTEHQDGSTELDTDEEIAHARESINKSKKTLKRKLRATSPSHFGQTLQELLAGEPTEEIPISLSHHIERQRAKEKEDRNTRNAQGQARKDAEEVRRITDIIGGWGAENERALRKVAQRGVIQLFNAIQQTQNHVTRNMDSSTSINRHFRPKKSEKPNILGQGKNDSVDANRFLDMIREGGIVSKH